MGEEIVTSHFNQEDFILFKESLVRETSLLGDWIAQNAFDEKHGMGGFELEAWIVDKQGAPLAVNDQLLDILNNPAVVPELAQFNVELNAPPYQLEGDALSRMHSVLSETWKDCIRVADKIGGSLMMVGILPSVREEELSVSNMSHKWRYRALNEQVLSMRDGKPFILNIHGHDDLHISHGDVMLEAATTSLQIHLQVSLDKAVRFYNAALILSAPMVAVCANSPYLFGKNLWEETRIPLFEQSVMVCPSGATRECDLNRVVFGPSYARESLLEMFIENRDHFPVLLPMKFDAPAESLCHLRLHNGTIWRWNRPIIGFGYGVQPFTEGGIPHLRIEHRVASAGPSVVDCVANAALFFGLVQDFATCEAAPEERFSFPEAESNFYNAARFGLDAQIHWNGKTMSVRYLFQEELISLARRGLQQLKLHQTDIDFYLGIIEKRVNTGQNGAAWQQAYVNKHHCNMQQLTTAYMEHQQSGKPVHEWPV